VTSSKRLEGVTEITVEEELAASFVQLCEVPLPVLQWHASVESPLGEAQPMAVERMASDFATLCCLAGSPRVERSW
jgi:hypothetical protein